MNLAACARGRREWRRDCMALMRESIERKEDFGQLMADGNRAKPHKEKWRKTKRKERKKRKRKEEEEWSEREIEREGIERKPCEIVEQQKQEGRTERRKERRRRRSLACEVHFPTIFHNTSHTNHPLFFVLLLFFTCFSCWVSDDSWNYLQFIVVYFSFFIFIVFHQGRHKPVRVWVDVPAAAEVCEGESEVANCTWGWWVGGGAEDKNGWRARVLTGGEGKAICCCCCW